MRTIILILLASGVLAGAADLTGSGTAAATVADAAVPTVREPTPVSMIIPIRNPYDRAVKITRVDSSCSCAKLELVDTFLIPGATTVLHLVANTANRSGEQSVTVSLYVSDPEFEPIETIAKWNVQAAVNVDSIGPGMDPLVRPADQAWQDTYRYPSKVRPDELNRLRKRIRLSSPTGTAPAGGLRVTGIDYRGTLWAFTPQVQPDGSTLITAVARDVNASPAEGTFLEKVTVRTNHPDKPTIELEFLTIVASKAGEVMMDPMAP